MKVLALFLVLSYALQTGAEESVVALTIKGMNVSADYVGVQKALAALPGVSRASFWIGKANYHVHVYVKQPLRLRDVEKALATAKKELKDTLSMDVDYSIDETRLRIASEARVTFTGGDAVLEAIRLVAPAEKVESRDTGMEARLSPKKDAPVTVAALRKAIEGAREKMLDVTLPGQPAPKARYACPNCCSESAAPGTCPKCARELEKVTDEGASRG